MAIFGSKPQVSPVAKMSIFRLFELHVFIVQKGVFSLQDIVKDILLAYIVTQKKLEERPFLDPLKKCQVSDFLNFFYIYRLERRFFALECSIRHFRGLYCLKKRFEKWPFLDQNHGLTPLKKCQFFDFLNFMFLQRRKVFFRSRISQKTFSWPILP